MDTDKTIVIKLKGGMGNQMFQYAFGKAIVEAAKNTGQILDLQFDITGYTNPIKKDTRRPHMLPLLNTETNIASDTVVEQAKNPYALISKVFRRTMHKLKIGNTAAYVPKLLKPPYKSYYEGYWQSEKYFLSIANEIRQEFTLREPLGPVAKAVHERITTDPKAVSIFYRRTDYVNHSVFDIGEQEYQKRALAKIHELVPDSKLYVMSDDIDWVKENANLPADSIFVSSDKIPAQEELFLMAACKHNIIPNSTFAWWGAWLNQNPDKIVIAPKNWVNGNTDEYTDITPKNWLRV